LEPETAIELAPEGPAGIREGATAPDTQIPQPHTTARDVPARSPESSHAKPRYYDDTIDEYTQHARQRRTEEVVEREELHLRLDSHLLTPDCKTCEREFNEALEAHRRKYA
jgi:hypothetical protein